MKGQGKIPEKQLNKVKRGNLPEEEYRIMIVKMIQDFGKRMETKIEKMQQMFTEDLEYLKNKQIEMKNILEGINTRITEAEAGVNDLENKMVEITGAEQSKERRMKRNEDRLRDLWDNIKCINICIVEVPERGERAKGPEKIFEDTLAENFPNMG